jgi:hypothetical protein
MIIEAFESYAKLNGRWLETWSHANAASIASMRIAFGQWELATLAARFMTERVRAYAEHDGRIEPLVRRLDSLTEGYGDDHARELRRIYAAWSELLRNDRALTPVSPPTSEGRNESADANGEFTRSDRAGERRGDVAH